MGGDLTNRHSKPEEGLRTPEALGYVSGFGDPGLVLASQFGDWLPSVNGRCALKETRGNSSNRQSSAGFNASNLHIKSKSVDIGPIICAWSQTSVGGKRIDSVFCKEDKL